MSEIQKESPAATEDKRPFCFVVCPIGHPGSDTRKRSDGIFQEIISPVIGGEFGYRVERADHDKGPGMVTESVITKLIEAELVIADLHGHNPNVMYEVAIRHATGDPMIQMIEDGEDLPFDIAGLNTIKYEFHPASFGRWRSHLQEAVHAVQRGDHGSNPVAQSAVYRALKADQQPGDKALALILDRLERLEGGPSDFGSASRPGMNTRDLMDALEDRAHGFWINQIALNGELLTVGVMDKGHHEAFKITVPLPSSALSPWLRVDMAVAAVMEAIEAHRAASQASLLAPPEPAS